MDTLVIELPPGFEVDDLPAPTDLDYSFSCRNKTEDTLVYTRTYEIKVPLDKLDQLKTFTARSTAMSRGRRC